MYLKNIKKVSIIGIARSGTAAAVFLKNKGYDIFISDIKNLDENNDFVKLLKEKNIDFETGHHSLEQIEDSDLIIVSPGVPLNSPALKYLKDKNKRIIGEIELAYKFCDKEAKIIGVTGTNGKSTTTALIGELFKNSGFKTVVGGNIGNPFINCIDDVDKDTVVVLELSSFQLDTIEDFRPNISIITNITPDHLDRYSNFEEYRDSKFQIINNQRETDYLILNDNIDIKDECKVNIIRFSSDSDSYNVINFDGKCLKYSINDRKGSFSTEKLILKGEHNYENISAAVSSALIFNIDEKIIIKTLENFEGLEHRLEFVRKVNGVEFYNDSKATNPESAVKSINAFEKEIILILGGRDKGTGFKILKEPVQKNVKFVVLVGESKELIKNELDLKDNFYIADTFEDSVRKSFEMSEKDDIILLAPACTSWDMFNDFEERGRVFKNLVNSLE